MAFACGIEHECSGICDRCLRGRNADVKREYITWRDGNIR